MTPMPDSASLVLRSSHILLVRIELSQVEPWSGTPGAQQRRTARLETLLEETLTGRTRQKDGAQVTVTVEQYQNEIALSMFSIPGIWSGVSIEPGTRLLIFARSSGDDLAELMVEPQCRAVVSAAEALTGVRLAIRAESEPIGLPELLRESNSSAASLDYIFIEYLATKFADPALAQPDIFALLMRLLENPQLPLVTRSSLLSAVFDEMMRTKIFPDRHVNAFAISLFHLLGLTEAARLRDNLASVFLPNLLGLAGGVAQRSADRVFRDLPGERQNAARILRDYGGDVPVDKLRAWLE